MNQDIEVAAGQPHSGDAMTVNGDVRVAAGVDAPDSNFKSVNGEIRVGDRAAVNHCATVNGTMAIGDGVRTGELKTVNGNLRVGRNADVRGDVKTLNGYVAIEDGSRVDGSVKTVNGKIRLHGTRVSGGVKNVNGGMLVTEGSVVEGDLVVKDAGDDRHSERPRIVIGPDSKVQGELIFERPVDLYVHESAEIGPVTGADVVTFTGNEPG